MNKSFKSSSFIGSQVPASTKKSLLEAQLKSENYELKAGQRDLYFLKSDIANLEHKLRLLEAEKDAMIQEYENKEKMRKDTIQNMEKELQVLNGTKDQRAEEIKKMMLEIKGMKMLVEEKNSDIEKYQSELNNYAEKVETVKNDKIGLENGNDQIRREKEKLQEQVDLKLEENNELLNEQDQIESELRKIQQNTMDLNIRFDEAESTLNSKITTRENITNIVFLFIFFIFSYMNKIMN